VKETSQVAIPGVESAKDVSVVDKATVSGQNLTEEMAGVVVID